MTTSFLRTRRKYGFAVFIFTLISMNAFAFGKKRVDPNADTQAFPARTISLGKIYNTGFKLPDGKTQVDFQQALPIVIATTFTDFNDKIRIADLNNPPSSTRYVVNGGVTSFVAEVAGLNIVFGYKPQIGDIGVGKLTGGEGKVKVVVSEFEMDFQIVDTQASPPTIIVAKYASARDVSVKLEFNIDFGQIQAGLDFVYNSPATETFRRLIRKVVDKMVQDPRTNFYLDWTGLVSKVDYDNHTLMINSGMRQAVGQNNVFTVYNGSDRIGEIRIDRLELDQAQAHFKDDDQFVKLNSTKAGDNLKVFFEKSPTKLR